MGVILKNETVINEMVEILDSIHKYVPTKRTTQEFDVPHGDEVTGIEHVSVQVDHFHHILLGGDQLTVARIRGAQSVRNNSENGRSCLGGFIPVVEDWHTKMCYLKVGKIIHRRRNRGGRGGSCPPPPQNPGPNEVTNQPDLSLFMKAA